MPDLFLHLMQKMAGGSGAGNVNETIIVTRMYVSLNIKMNILYSNSLHMSTYIQSPLNANASLHMKC